MFLLLAGYEKGKEYKARTPVLFYPPAVFDAGEPLALRTCVWCEREFKLPLRMQAFCCSQRCADSFRQGRSRDPQHANEKRWPRRQALTEVIP